MSYCLKILVSLKMGHHPKWKDPQQKRQGQPLVVAREKIWLVVTGTMEF
jgi:hypothetical protein